MNKIICEGNECSFSWFAVNGCADITIRLTDIGDDDCVVIYEDGLYKLIKNGELVSAATSALIKYVDKTKH